MPPAPSLTSTVSGWLAALLVLGDSDWFDGSLARWVCAVWFTKNLLCYMGPGPF